MTATECSVIDCDRDRFCRGWCSMHYARWRRTGSVALQPRLCSLPECDRKHRRNGFCDMHATRWKKHGDPRHVDVIKGDPERRFWEKVDITDGCWLWTAFVTDQGYAPFKVDGVSVGAHRFSYELLVGPIPDGLVIDHLCRVRHCVNPAHLEAVTERENLLRGSGAPGVNARKTHCKHGHEFSPENTHVRRDGTRICRPCRREASARLRAEYRRANPR